MELVVRVYIPPFHTSFYPQNGGFILGVAIVAGVVVVVGALVVVDGNVWVLGSSFGPPMCGHVLSFVVFVLSWTTLGLPLHLSAPP